MHDLTSTSSDYTFQLSFVPSFRKKKLTSHWRRFIRPLMWRCKWTELKINQLKSQESNYARKLAAQDLRKSMELDQSMLEGFGSRSLPIANQHRRKKAMKRRKRKRIEDTIDVASYMSRHNLFSYLGTSFFLILICCDCALLFTTTTTPKANKMGGNPILPHLPSMCDSVFVKYCRK